jgi:shikimate kinase
MQRGQGPGDREGNFLFPVPCLLLPVLMLLSLIGYRGTGKSTVARLVALALGWEWIDADVEIEWRAGKSIKTIFDDDGEPAFRDLESAILAELCRRDRAVLALGGGVVLREENRHAIKAAGPVVWLAASAETLAQRIAADATTVERRPNLTAQGGITEIITMLGTRDPLYRDCASLVVDTEGKTPAEVAGEILTWLNSQIGDVRGLDSSHPA